jgi:hypothetical protein
MIQLRFCKLEFTPEGAMTHWPDGTQWGALPHDTPSYHYAAYRYGHDGDTLAYCRFHELAHHLICEALGSHSLVIFALAHGEQPSPAIAAAEEALTMTLHRYVTTVEPPLIEGIGWQTLRKRFLECAS